MNAMSPSISAVTWGALGRLARWWWVGAAIFALVAAGALARDYGPGAGRVYTSSAATVIVAMPQAGEQSALDASLRWQHEEATARSLARSGFLNTVAFGAATAAQVDRDTGGAQHLDAHKVAAALSAIDAGNALRLTARWPGPQAQAIAAAATEVLTQDAATAGLPTEDRAHLAVRDRADVIQAASIPALDPQTERARVLDLASRLGTGLLLGLAAAGAAAWVDSRRQHVASVSAR